ncbi:hypothetical protein E5676_scaffold259G00540 [Cucumis melo var. makuwa]|uniref:Uncharacterized protein n=2 Tax=Cucumis melo TaxID=3656 RepID=A0A5D3CUI3_CUCMM|nr:hypothetical protein E6C27_scaffold538G00730 [Cucumis melo var. makuwa]TYK15122.1 hypothetical protein E5676_scaffold259G00540 [Cucumis melo var. makuwa]
METSFSFSPFHADKAIVTFKDPTQATLLCNNNEWSTIGSFYVRFEKWSFKKHAAPILVPSYGGWVSFRGIPLSAWKTDTFIQIGNACRGFLDVAKETKTRKNLVEARIKIRYNYSSFIPTNISIKDDNGHLFFVQAVTHENGK